MVVSGVWVHRNKDVRLEMIDVAQVDGGFTSLDTCPLTHPLWIPAFAGMTGVGNDDGSEGMAEAYPARFARVPFVGRKGRSP